MKKYAKVISLPLALIGLIVLFSPTAFAATYIYPVIGSTSFSNDYNDIHGGVVHHAIDIIADKHKKIVSATDGTIEYVTYPEPSWGNAVIIRSTGGYCYWYLHINNDDEGTDNGKGGAMKAFAPDINPGNPIKKGQLIGWVGDSGNAESTVSHLHFGVHKLPNSSARCATNKEDDNPPINPYNNLKAATHISKPASYPALPDEMLPFGAGYKGKINVTRGDADNDGDEDLIVAAGSGGGPRVSVYDGTTKSRIVNFYAFDKTLRYGTDIAVGDVDGDGKNEIVATTRTSAGPQVAVYRIVNGTTPSVEKVGQFKAFDSGKNNSPRIAVGDIDGSGTKKIIVGAGNGALPVVRVFDMDGTLVKEFSPYADSYKGGVDVTAGDVTGTTADEIVVSPLTTASSRVQIFDGTSFSKLSEFYAYGSSYRGGAWISAGNIDQRTAKMEIATMPNGGGPRVSYFNGQGQQLRSSYYMERWWRGYYDIAAGNGTYSVSTGYNRRGSVR